MTPKLYELFRWHSSDSKPSRVSVGTLSEMREEMAAYVQGHEVSALYPAKGFGNDRNRVTLSSKLSLCGSWGIQYWIKEAEPETFNLAYVTSTHFLPLFTEVSKEQVLAILSAVKEGDRDKWRVSSNLTQVYSIGDYWLQYLA